MSERETCPYHEGRAANIADLDKRLALAESEVERMTEKLDKVMTKLEDMSSTLTRWTITLGVYSGLASVALFVAMEWDKIKGWFQ